MRPTGFLVLLKARQKKKTGRYPVKVRVVFQRRYHDYRTGIDLTEEEFNQANSSKPGLKYRATAVRLNEVKARMNNVLANSRIFTFQKFREAFYGKAPGSIELYQIFTEYSEKVFQEERIKSAVAYKTAANSIREFSPSATIYDVDETFLKKYHAYLEVKGKSITTIGIYIRALRAVYNYAIAKKLIKKDEDYPFVRSKYVIPSSSNTKKSLTPAEINKILEFPCAYGSFADRAKDFWLLSYLCNGINFKDIALLKRKNIDGEMIRFVREKTKRTSQSNQRTISCYASAEVLALVQKWQKKEIGQDSYLFDIVSECDNAVERQKKIDQFVQNTNKNLKRICQAVGVDKPVTTYYSRHSAATTLKRSGASILQIQEALGHSSSIVTQKYLDSFEDDSKKELGLTLLKNIKNG